MRVLLVLDKPMLVQFATFTLTHGVYDTRTVSTEADAADALATCQPHLVLLDTYLVAPRITDRLGRLRRTAAQCSSAASPVVAT